MLEKVANQIDEFSAKIANQSAESLNRTNDIINDSANQLQQSSEAFTTAFDNMIEKSNKLPEFLTGNALTGLLDQNIKSSEQQLNKLDKSYNDLLTDWNQLNNNLNAKQSELKNNPEDKLLSAQIDALKKAMDLNDGQRAEVLAEITKWINNTNDLTGAKTHWSQIIEMINQTVKPAYDDLQKATKTGSEFDIAQANDTYNNALENAKIQIDNMANQTKYTAVASEYLAAALLNVKSTSEQMDLIMKKAFLDDSAIDIFSNYDAVASDFFGKESSYKDLENRFGMNIEPTLEQLEQFSRQMIFIAATATDQGDIDQAIENLRKLNDQIKKLTKEKISSNFFKDLFKGKSLSESIANAFSTAVQPTLDILADTLGDFFANIRKNGEDENRNFSFANLFNSDSWSNLKDTVLSGDSLMALGGLAGNYLSASSPSNSTGSIIGGALTGGSAGFQAYGVYGAIAGAIIGAIGGAFGGGGSKYVRYEPDELDTHESYDDYLSADANARRKNFQINDEEWDKVLKGWDDYTRSLSASISDIASNITSAFSADNYIGFLQSWNQSLYEQTRTALIKGFMAQEAYQGLYKTLSDTISYAVLDGSLSDEEKLAIKNAGNNIATQMKPLYDALNSLEDMFVGGSGSSSSSSGNYTAGSSSPIVYNNYITISAQAFAGNEDEARSFALLMRDYIVAEEQRG
jgi:hypothetical protein